MAEFHVGLTVNPKAELKVIWTNSWYDPGREREAANTLISQGADVLAPHRLNRGRAGRGREGQIRVRLPLRYGEVRAESAAQGRARHLGLRGEEHVGH